MTCISCDRLTHEKCGKKKEPFYCKHCEQVDDLLDTSDINENLLENVLSETNLHAIPVIVAGHNNSFLNEDLLGVEEFPEHKCPSCNDIFRTNSDLADHFINHEDFRWTCQICENNFKTQEEHKEHVDSHHGSNFPIPIESCSAEDFTQFLCSNCDKIYETEGELGEHLQVHHSLPECCELCGMSFQAAEDKAKHVDNEHGQILDL